MLNSHNKSPDKGVPNPFYKPQTPTGLGRREFVSLSTLAIFSGIYTSYAAEELTDPKGKGKGKGGKGGGKEGKGGHKGPNEFILPQGLTEFSDLPITLGRPTNSSITVSVLSKNPMEGFFEIGTQPGQLKRKTALTTFPAGQPIEIIFDELKPNTEYFYRIQYRSIGTPSFSTRSECRFSTQRAPGNTFNFTIQGDSHPERMGKVTHPELYARTLLSAASVKPDFHICIGDDFSVEHIPTVSQASVAEAYRIQRPFLGLIGQTSPLFLLNGNHEQASLFNYNQTDARRDVAVFAQLARNQFFPTPSPDNFYSGNTVPLKDIGLLKDYCAWTWGDALFVLLDNYWHSPSLVDSGFAGGEGGQKPHDGKKDRDWWGITIGDAQYAWLKKTLESSKAKYKFVFAHHVLGSGRGGVEEADLYEWGGQGKKGEETFAQKRPKWELPIHQLMVKHKVTIFFQGHDHLFCSQEKDGIIYQEIPMPSDKDYTAYNEDRYTSGTRLPNSGFLNVTVSPTGVKVDYIRSFLPTDESPQNKHGSIAHSYTIPTRTT